MNEEQEERMIEILLMNAGRGLKKPHKRHGKVMRYAIRAWRYIRMKVSFAFWWVMFHTWHRGLVEKGRARWKLMAGLGSKPGYQLGAERAGQIYYPQEPTIEVFKRWKAAQQEFTRLPKPDAE